MPFWMGSPDQPTLVITTARFTEPVIAGPLTEETARAVLWIVLRAFDSEK
jgi:hypothetical protein